MTKVEREPALEEEIYIPADQILIIMEIVLASSVAHFITKISIFYHPWIPPINASKPGLSTLSTST